MYDDFCTINVSVPPGFPINIITFQQNMKDDFVDCNRSLVMGEVIPVGGANRTLTNIYSTHAPLKFKMKHFSIWLLTGRSFYLGFFFGSKYKYLFIFLYLS